MRRTPRFFSSKLTTVERRVYGAATAWFVLAAAAMLWPLVTPFARVRPLVLDEGVLDDKQGGEDQGAARGEG